MPDDGTARSSLLDAANSRRRPISSAPPLVSMEEAENRLLGSADEDQETPAPTLQTGPQVVSSASRQTAVTRPRKPQPSGVLADLMAKSRKPKIQMTPLHINISVQLDNALRRAMSETGLEKTTIVTGALMPVLAPYLED